VSRQPQFSAEDFAEHDAIREGLKEQAARREQADVIARAARREIGALLHRAAVLEERRGLKVEITDAAGLTGLSRPTLYAIMAGQPAMADSGDYKHMPDAAVAAASLEHYEAATAELHARFPHVAAIREAAAWLTRQYEDRSPTSPAEWLAGPPAPGADELYALYMAHVQAIAAGWSMAAVDRHIPMEN
jgi:hypothetical protein